MRSLVLAIALTVSLVALVPGCDRGAPPVPATSDPNGDDLVPGAVVAAVENSGGIRIYKVVHVDDLPIPFGPDLHMIAYNPKVETFEAAAKLRRNGGMSIAIDHLLVRRVNFMPRDHRVIATEPITDAEKAPYLQSTKERQ